MVTGNSVFKYKTKSGILHKVPAVIKLLLLLPLSLFCMTLPPFWLGVGIASAVIVSFICGLSLREQLTDFKPAFYYAILMYGLSVFTSFIDNLKQLPVNQFYILLIPQYEYLRITLRLVLIVQISALLFRTTSLLEIREVIRSEIITLFLCFIPEIFKIWTSVNLAWKSRGGKEGFAKIKTLCFVLISLSFEKAALKSKALSARSIA
jgi:energy-coupling factor transporter transmembrane protein EcfT